MRPNQLTARSSHATCAALLLMAGACVAPALAIPTSGGRENTGLRITDTVNGRTLISPNGASIVSDTLNRTTVTVDSVEGGVDITVVYTNPGSAPLPLGMINIGGIRLGPVITRKEFLHDNREYVINSQSQQGAYGAPSYPDESYSPVSVFADENYWFGASLCYPIEEYDHKIDMFLMSKAATSWGGSANWQLTIRLWDDLPAGQTRTYRVPIRFVNRSSHWLETLKPYREYFHGLYGDVRYTRDPRPVRTFAISYLEFLSDSNRRGFYNPTLDPERNGYGPWANYIRSRCEALGYERTMIWGASGLYYNHRDDNFPCMVMSGADSIPIMASTQSSFSAISQAGIDLGFWYGYSSSVAPGGWDTGHVRVDPDNPAHMALVYAEFDRLAAVGTKTVGMDAFGWEVTPGKSLRYLKMLSQRYPQIRFVTEVSLGDIYHVYAPTFMFGNQISTPNYLADFLLPGNETWCLTGYVDGTEEAELAEMRHFASMGYVPLSAGVIPPPPDIVAAETWLELPESVRAPRARVNARENDGSMAAGLGALLTRTNRDARNSDPGGGPEVASRSGGSGGDAGAGSNEQAVTTTNTVSHNTNPTGRQRVRFKPSATGDAIPVANGEISPVLPTGTAEALAVKPAEIEKPMISSDVSGAAPASRSVATVSGSKRPALGKSGSAVPPSVSTLRRKVPFVSYGTQRKRLEFSAKDARQAVLPNLQQAKDAVNRVRNIDDDRQNAAADEE